MKQKVIYIYINPSSFVKKDIEVLSEKFEVIPLHQNWADKNKTPLLFIKQFFFLLFNTYKCRGIFVMFGGYWSFLPTVFGKIFEKKVFIILGGTDCVSFPSFNYGSLRKPILKKFIGLSYRLAYKLLPKDESLVYYDEIYYQEAVNKHQGFKYFFPKLKTPYEVIHNGYDTDFCSENHIIKTPNSFMMIGLVTDEMRIKLKGVDVLIQLAKHKPNCSFILVGIHQSVISSLGNLPPNLKLFPFLVPNEFKKYLVKSEFIMQLSISEGFPNALCEGMLCNCIPIGTHVGGIPTIIGDSGFLFKSSNINFIKSQFDEIAELSAEEKLLLGSKAKNRIIEKFSIEKRAKMLTAQL